MLLKKPPTREFIDVKYHAISPHSTPSRMNSGICHSSKASAGASVTARIAPSQPVTFRRSESPRTRCSAIFSPPRCFVRFAFSLV